MNNSSWKLCFEQYMALMSDTRAILRNCAVNHIIDNGADEVGSSDISHELYAMWRYAGGNWQTAIINEVNNQ